MRDIGLIMGKGSGEGLGITHQNRAAGFGNEHPLVRIDTYRVGTFEPGKKRCGFRSTSGRQPVGAVDMQPDAEYLANIG